LAIPSRGIRGVWRRHRKSVSFAAQSISRACCAVEPLEGRLLLSGAPTAPVGVLATNGTTPTDIEVTWNSASGATSYQVWRNTTGTTSSATDIAPDVTSTSFDDTSVTVGTTYFYWVVASDESGGSPYSTIASATGGTLVWNDTFGATGISSAWGAFNATDPNNGAVIYTNTSAANSTADNPTTLQVVSDSQATDGQALAMSLTPSPNQSGDYDSAEISTEFDPSGVADNMEYGEIQARIKIPGGNNSGAIWPAFWLLGDDISTVSWPACGEIDVMENDGANPSTIDSTIHGPMSNGQDYNYGSGVGASDTISGDFYSSYHVFAVNWGPNSITFSVDGHAFETLTPASLPSGSRWVFNGQPFFIILDVCEGGNFAPGTITSTQTMDVDYVRAYSLPPPTGIAAAIATNTTPANVTWSAVNGATSYEVWRNTSSSVLSAKELNGNVTGTSYTDTSAVSGTKYYYWIVSANAAQTSGYSASAFTRLTPEVSVSSPPPNIAYDGTNDVTSWATASVSGVNGSPAPTGSTSLVYYSGTTDTGTPLSSPPIGLGTYTVVGTYAGDNNYVPAQSSPVTFTINNPSGLSTTNGTQYTITWNAGTPTLDVSTGVVTLSADLSVTFPNYNLTIENGASVLLDAGQHVAQLQVIGNGALNIESYWMMINYGANSDPFLTIQSYLATGDNEGSWNGAGIDSSAAATSFGRYGIGVADGADDVVAGLASGQIEILYTLYGDTNLDGTVNSVDFGAMAANFGKSGKTWDEGDFNYDGTVNSIDFGLLAGDFGQSSANPNLPTVQLLSVTLTPTTIPDPVASTTISTDSVAPAASNPKPSTVSNTPPIDAKNLHSKFSAATSPFGSPAAPSPNGISLTSQRHGADALFLSNR
jgi:beta-glucanase (GH16 family)